MLSHESIITVADHPTSILISLYSDRLMFVITQVGTLGTIVHAQKESILGGGTTYSTATLLGHRDDPLPELCARQLIEKISTSVAGFNLPILVCLGLDRKLIANINNRNDNNSVVSSAGGKNIVATIVDTCFSSATQLIQAAA